MGWGRLKPFWKNAKWKKSAEKGTGIFSWGDSDYAKALDVYLPGVGTSLDTALDKLADNKDAFTGPNRKGINKAKVGVNVASFINTNPQMTMAIGAFVLYKLLK